MKNKLISIDGCNAVAQIAYKTNEIIAIYPISPSSPMGEQADEWASAGKENIWNEVPSVVEMQSEGGAIGTVHGALQTGSLSTSFTSSQGLLLMIPNLYKIAGELTPFVLHVAARTVATHALSIFCDHSDVMSVRQTGFALLSSSSVQEAHDFALISQSATLKSRVPFIHFMDGYRTSHEINKIEQIDEKIIRDMISEEKVLEVKQRRLTSEKPSLRGSSANPDTFFQSREVTNTFYDNCADIVDEEMNKFYSLTGRRYQPFEYIGDNDATRIIISMGSSTETVAETVNWLNTQQEKVGVIKVKLYRPFSVKHFLRVLPNSVKSIAVLDRTKEPGSIGEPLYLDIVSAIFGSENFKTKNINIIGGRYGLSSKEFTPANVLSIFNELKKDSPKSKFTVGIKDDITNLSLDPIDVPAMVKYQTQAMFYGLGSDGTVSAAKNTIKIIGDHTNLFAQGYFVYDSKKAGALTVSHLRIHESQISAPYLVTHADFIGVHRFEYLNQYDILDKINHGGVFLLNTPYSSDETWNKLPKSIQEIIIDKKLNFYVINALNVAKQAKLGNRINTVMQTAFFALSGIFEKEKSIKYIKDEIERAYGKKGPEIILKNFNAVDLTIESIEKINIPAHATSNVVIPPIVDNKAPDFVKNITAMMLAGKGDILPVSAFPVDGTWETGTTKWEKRNLADEIPIWQSNLCTQCNYCTVICPHAAIRAKVVESDSLNNAPSNIESLDVKARDMKGQKYILQVAPEDCTGCNLCVEICPAKDRKNPGIKAINMKNQLEHVATEAKKYDFFLKLEEKKPNEIERIDVRTSQLMEPLFEYSGACSGCGETPYIKLITQLYGDRLLIANSTGCSSIYGGNLPTTPYSKNKEGQGPAWANSLFEDTAEFGFGFKLSVDYQFDRAKSLLKKYSNLFSDDLVELILDNNQTNAKEIAEQRKNIKQLCQQISKLNNPNLKMLEEVSSDLIRKSIWIIGGDGWAYDIGYGGLDHVLSMNENINVLVMDTQCYSNTGGQQSKATPLGAIAKFAAKGKRQIKKDLGLTMSMYGHIYVAQVALGAQLNQTVKAIQEAEAYPGPSLIIAYSPCEAHGYDLSQSVTQTKNIVDSGMWPLYRFDPENESKNKPGMQLDSKSIKKDVDVIMDNEGRFSRLQNIDSDAAEELKEKAREYAKEQMTKIQEMAKLHKKTES
ncbi:pyruvate:ferredoxin (flavodoxin) oxidoreductase [Paraphotobacterium marinum]|uniref:pyruvate:ferredoxin (flavodoxin) oxidoreductase n=1 Tax=Paraphotobacterium marinum TaxID=1755811 RepID=UPI0039EBBCB1